MAVQILRLTVAHRARIIAEYLIECRDVVGDQRPLIPFKGCSNLCNHIRTIDLQFVAPKVTMRLSPQSENYPIQSNEAFDRGLSARVGRNALRLLRPASSSPEHPL
jgi:hypothetical protein